MQTEKPIAVKPSLYAVYFFALKEIAFKYGYNLCIHGSMNRDLDLIAFPWGKETNPNHFEMVDEFKNHLGGEFNQANNKGDLCDPQPNGSLKYIINIWRRTPFSAEKDQEYYIDINIFQSNPAPVPVRQEECQHVFDCATCNGSLTCKKCGKTYKCG